jgi:hypothetical protein
VKGLNPYYRVAEISEPKNLQIIDYFALDLTAKKNQAGKFADLAVNGVA